MCLNLGPIFWQNLENTAVDGPQTREIKDKVMIEYKCYNIA